MKIILILFFSLTCWAQERSLEMVLRQQQHLKIKPVEYKNAAVMVPFTESLDAVASMICSSIAFPRLASYKQETVKNVKSYASLEMKGLSTFYSVKTNKEPYKKFRKLTELECAR